jgi:putative aldouronate transport system substrate-binding protein
MAEDLRIQDFETNGMTRLIEQGANVDMEFVMYPRSDYINKLNLVVMAGGQDLPDVIIGGFDDSMIFRWAKAGAIIPLTKYYKDPNTSANIQAAIKKTEVNFLPQITSPDSEIYYVPRFLMDMGNEHQPKAWYYTPWLQKLGLKAPTTTDEFREVLRKIVTSDPNGNGRPDEIGMTGTFTNMRDVWSLNWFQFFMNAFIFAGDGDFFVVNNGKISVAYNTPEWRDGLKYIRSLFAEGLIPVENLTQDIAQARTIINADPHRVFIIPFADLTHVNASNPAGDDYMFLPPLKGPKGVQFAGYRPSVPNAGMLISANCKNPDAAFRMGDYMLRPEFGIITRYGEEGVQWDYPQNAKNLGDFQEYIPGWPIRIVVYDDSTFSGGSEVSNCSWRQAGPYYADYGLPNGLGIRKDAFRRQIRKGPSREAYANPAYQPKEVISKLIYTEEELLEIDEIMITLRSYVQETTSNFLAGNRDIDATWNAYINEFNAIGLPKVLSTVQKVYDRMSNKEGL